MNLGCFCVFFFEAEDGIRDSSVTGVQTCALPILFAQFWTVMYWIFAPFSAVVELVALKGAKIQYITVQNWANNVFNLVTKRGVAHRSEERRVGKEGRSRWSPYH